VTADATPATATANPSRSTDPCHAAQRDEPPSREEHKEEETNRTEEDEPRSREEHKEMD